MAKEQKPRSTKRSKGKQPVKQDTEDAVAARRLLWRCQTLPYARTAPTATYYPTLQSVEDLPLIGGVSFGYRGKEGIRLSERNQLVAKHFKNRDQLMPHSKAKNLSPDFVVHFMWEAYPTSTYAVRFPERLSQLKFAKDLCEHLVHFTQNVAPTLQCADPEWSLGPGGKYGVDDLAIRQVYTSDGANWYLDIQVLLSPEEWTRRPENRKMIDDACESANAEGEDASVEPPTACESSPAPVASSSYAQVVFAVGPVAPTTDVLRSSPSSTIPGLSPTDTPSPANSLEHNLVTPSTSPSAHWDQQLEGSANVEAKAPLSVEDMFVFASGAQVAGGEMVMDEDPFAFLSSLPTYDDFDAMFGTASTGFGEFDGVQTNGAEAFGGLDYFTQPPQMSAGWQ